MEKVGKAINATPGTAWPPLSNCDIRYLGENTDVHELIKRLPKDEQEALSETSYTVKDQGFISIVRESDLSLDGQWLFDRLLSEPMSIGPSMEQVGKPILEIIEHDGEKSLEMIKPELSDAPLQGFIWIRVAEGISRPVTVPGSVGFRQGVTKAGVKYMPFLMGPSSVETISRISGPAMPREMTEALREHLGHNVMETFREAQLLERMKPDWTEIAIGPHTPFKIPVDEADKGLTVDTGLLDRTGFWENQ